jgi:Tol biopolymer transport system component
LLAALLTLACLVGGTATPAPGTDDQVATSVDQTLQAITPEEPPGLLPQPLYYRAPDGGGITQVYRLDEDGVTVTQLTFEPANVDGFDVNPLDGSLAYVANNQLLRMNADGSGRQVLVDGGPLNQNEAYLNAVSSPLWSRDGATIAFGYMGLNFYSIATGTYANVLPNYIETFDNFSVPRELFYPSQYSPDGSHLLLFVGWYEGGSLAIYTPSSSSLVRASFGGIFIGTTAWVPDGSAVYVASPDLGLVSSGIWRVNLDGSVNEIMPTQNPDTTFNYADAPWFAPDGQMYFFYGTTPDYPNGNVPLTLVRSAMDGVTGRTPVLTDTFVDYTDITWAPDGSLFIVTRPPAGELFGAGPATVYFVDGRPPVQILLVAEDLHWGP